ncbi:MAG: MBOAT family protein [Leptospiraceae bacterium]|nr:MBOAT family protein [Leptospiraceae bacterium]
MLFTSIEFFIFFGLVFIFQWYIHPLFSKEDGNDQSTSLHVFLLVASYYFYMSWDYRFGALILISTLIDYYLAIQIFNTENIRMRKLYLLSSLILNLVCILGFFKYYNFFARSLNGVAGNLGYSPFAPILDIILPVGISFFTFQSLSYTIDVYRKVIPVEKSLLRFALYVSFFPQLVAGPIVTAKTFLPQLFRKVKLEEIDFKKAIRYFLLGYFKKVVISDNVSPIVDLIFKNPENYGTSALWLANILFAIQLYGDFSGYTDMAYSSALLLGYELPENFYLPFKATSVTDFWRRWHISLSTWLRDYIYISLGGSRYGKSRHKFNLFMTMFLGGIWHGANWTFFLWGTFMGFFLAVESIAGDLKEKYFKGNYSKFNFILNPIGFIYGMGFVVFACTLFRGESLEKSILMMKNMVFYVAGNPRPYMIKTCLSVVTLVFLGHLFGHWIYEKKRDFKIPYWLELVSYPFLILGIAYFTNDNEAPFIYFQF